MGINYVEIRLPFISCTMEFSSVWDSWRGVYAQENLRGGNNSAINEIVDAVENEPREVVA